MLNFGHWAYKNFSWWYVNCYLWLAEHFLSSLWSEARALANLRYLWLAVLCGYTPIDESIMSRYIIIEWFQGIHWKIFCKNLQYQPSGRYWNHSIVLSHRLLIAIINHQINHFIEKLLKQNKLINRTVCPMLPLKFQKKKQIFLNKTQKYPDYVNTMKMIYFNKVL